MNEKELNDKIDYYLSLPYKYEIEPQSDGTYFITVKELKGCMSEGQTISEAELMIKDAMESWLESMLECGNKIPLPESMQKEVSGKILIRIPKKLHRKLIHESNKEGVSLNSYIISLLSQEQSKLDVLSEVQELLDIQKYEKHEIYESSSSSKNLIKFNQKILLSENKPQIDYRERTA